MCLPWNHEFFTWWHVSVKLYQFWPSTTRVTYTSSKFMTTGRTHVFTWIHMKTHTGGTVPIMNQYDTCQLVQKWFLKLFAGLPWVWLCLWSLDVPFIVGVNKINRFQCSTSWPHLPMLCLLYKKTTSNNCLSSHTGEDWYVGNCTQHYIHGWWRLRAANLKTVKPEGHCLV